MKKKLITTTIIIIINSAHIVLVEKPTHIGWFDSELNLRKVLIAKDFFLILRHGQKLLSA